MNPVVWIRRYVYSTDKPSTIRLIGGRIKVGALEAGVRSLRTAKRIGVYFDSMAHRYGRFTPAVEAAAFRVHSRQDRYRGEQKLFTDQVFRAIRQHPNQKELKPLLLEYGALVEERKDLIGFGRQRPYPLPTKRVSLLLKTAEELRKRSMNFSPKSPTTLPPRSNDF